MIKITIIIWWRCPPPGGSAQRGRIRWICLPGKPSSSRGGARQVSEYGEPENANFHQFHINKNNSSNKNNNSNSKNNNNMFLQNLGDVVRWDRLSGESTSSDDNIVALLFLFFMILLFFMDWHCSCPVLILVILLIYSLKRSLMKFFAWCHCLEISFRNFPP